jgi:hypothetical protein
MCPAPDNRLNGRSVESLTYRHVLLNILFLMDCANLKFQEGPAVCICFPSGRLYLLPRMFSFTADPICDLTVIDEAASQVVRGLW